MRMQRGHNASECKGVDSALGRLNDSANPPRLFTGTARERVEDKLVHREHGVQGKWEQNTLLK